MTNQLKYFFKPAGVALIGASSNPAKLSHGILRNMLQHGYSGKIYPVNPSSKEILGLPGYPDISSVPDPIELAVIVLPAPMVLDSLVACGKRGLKAVIVISGGFKEIGPEGSDLEKKCAETAKYYHMRMIGPNCVGTTDLYSGLNTTFIKGLADKGPIGFVSQSGAVCGAIVDLVCGKGIGFSHFVSLGNEADVTETDLIEYLKDDENTSVIACYVEAIREGQRFIKICREVTKKKPVVLLKAGQTSAGARAVSSHTGSLAGSLSAYEAALKQGGVILARTTAELIDISYAFSTQPLPRGNRVVIVTNSGGPAALASDNLSNNNIKLADLSETTQKALRTRLNPSAQTSNPVDMLGGAEPSDFEFAIQKCLEDPNVDAVLAIHVPTAVVNEDEIALAIGKAANQSNKPVFACIMGEFTIGKARLILSQHHIPVYQYPEQIGKVLGSMLAYQQRKNTPRTDPIFIPKVDLKSIQTFLPPSPTKELGEAHIRPLLAEYQFPLIPAEIAVNEEQAVQIFNQMKSAIVMKIVSPDILHKSDAGGIKLNLCTEKDVKSAFSEIIQNGQRYNPHARIEGVIIEPMAPKGQEVIIGMKRDPQFGPLLMFGLGGIYVELFVDVSFRIAPISSEEAVEMIKETRAGKLLAGIRGHKPADIHAVVECIQKLAQISLDYPEIEEIEINPLLVLEEKQGAMALDARAILK